MHFSKKSGDICIDNSNFVSQRLFNINTIEKRMMEDYKKCTSVCAATISSPQSDDELAMLKLCNDECKKKFLNATEIK